MVDEKEIKKALEKLNFKIQERYGYPPYGLSIRHDDVSPKPRGPLVCHFIINEANVTGIYFNRIGNEKLAKSLTEPSLWKKGSKRTELKNNKYDRIILDFNPNSVMRSELVKTILKLKNYHSKK